MKQILLAGGLVAYVGDEDFEQVSGFPWWGHAGDRTMYARTQLQPSRRPLYMHVLLLGRRAGFVVDHIDGNGLNNQRQNLRWATNPQSLRNRRPHRNGKSKFKGVFRPSGRAKWRAEITVNYKKLYLGSFDTEIEAARAYNEAASLHHADYAWLNPIPA